ncbi:DNA polymerase III delta subunit [Marinobacterium lacunae]|uniref:DNA polymerase III subunit delta n=1 Tax=Marinobacterium lacunae TaxID=1232683 RepID=A0A081G0W8_9GAMM|nr:DNA polymerase III subunit delta [Marinobacterium lacunae]KEA64423.1 DNA polymerase III delta subunit [Marinobacterium lacunae]MBR9882334.1 DNA polymerase III subunit delta [Oceanospirillales bacterium]
MKLRADQLAQQLQRQPEALPVYLVTGDEPLLCGESVDAIRAHLRQLGFTEREVMHVDASFSWESLLESANALSLFAERKVIEIRLGNQKLNKASSDLLQRYLSNPAPDNALLIICDRLERNVKQSAWFKTVEQIGAVVEVWPIEPDQLVQWLGQRAASQGVQLEPEALQLLADRIEGNLLAARQELDKLALLYPGQRLSPEQVVQAVSDSSRFDIFALTDAALLADPGRAQHVLQVLRQEGNESAVVLWALTRDIRMLHRVSRALAAGQPYDPLCQKERIWGKRKQLVRNACRRLRAEQLEAMLDQAATVDLAIKGQRRDDPWLLLSQITLTLAGCQLPWQHTAH